MELRILHEFLVLAQTENFLEASDLLFISQPTLSRHIKSLEEELGVPLFERTTRHVRLNKYGYMLLPYAKQFVELNSQFSNQLISEKREKYNQLNIATIPAMGLYDITSVFTQFREKHGKCRINIMPTYAMSVIEKLRRRDCELAFVREQNKCSNDEVVRLPFSNDHIIAVVPEDHPLATYDSIPLSDLKGEDIITLPRDTIICDVISSACMKVGFEPHIIMTDHNIGHLIDCIRLGMGIGLLMSKHLNFENNRIGSVKAIDVTPLCHTYIYFCYLRDVPLSDNARAFIAMYKERFGIDVDND